MNFLRVFFVGGVIAYRGLFNWIRPSIYIPTMLGAPLFQILFFAYLGRFSQSHDDTFFVVGNAVQVASMSSVYGMTMAIANERWFGTLAVLLGSPANRLAVFLGRGLPILANGVLVSAFGFVCGRLLLDFHPPLSSVPPLALITVISAVSCTAFGMLLGSIGLRGRDFFFIANLAYFLMLLFCGVNVDLDSLPAWMEAVGHALPISHGIEAAREVVGGASLGSVAGLVWAEVGIGAAYAAVAFGLFRYFEADSRRRATLELI